MTFLVTKYVEKVNKKKKKKISYNNKDSINYRLLNNFGSQWPNTMLISSGVLRKKNYLFNFGQK